MYLIIYHYSIAKEKKMKYRKEPIMKYLLLTIDTNILHLCTPFVTLIIVKVFLDRF